MGYYLRILICLTIAAALCSCNDIDDGEKATAAGSIQNRYRVDVLQTRDGQPVDSLNSGRIIHYMDIMARNPATIRLTLSLVDNYVNIPYLVLDGVYVYGKRYDVSFDYHEQATVELNGERIENARVSVTGWMRSVYLTREPPPNPGYNGELTIEVDTPGDQYRFIIDNMFL